MVESVVQDRTASVAVMLHHLDMLYNSAMRVFQGTIQLIIFPETTKNIMGFGKIQGRTQQAAYHLSHVAKKVNYTKIQSN